MSIQDELMNRANSKCEFCESDNNLAAYEMPYSSEKNVHTSVLACDTCMPQIQDPTLMDANHWRCINGSMWSEQLPVQVMSWRLLNHLRSEGWAQDLLDQMYLDDEAMAWAKEGQFDPNDDTKPTLDSNGARLAEGDSVTLIKDLVVKGANFTAKRGTLVKNISLTDNPLHIDGRVNGTLIVLVSNFLKKVN